MPDRAAGGPSPSQSRPGRAGRAYFVLYFSWACPCVPLCLGLPILGTPRHAQGPPRSITANIHLEFSGIANIHSDDVLAPLCVYSFVKRSPAKHSISIHRFVHDVMREIIEAHIKDDGNLYPIL